MKIKNIIASLILSVTMGAGVITGISMNKKAQSAEAATNSVTLAGSFNSWSTTADPLTLNGDYWTIEKTLAVDDTFKVVVNGSDWVGDGDGVTWCSGMGSEGKGNNFKVLTAGTYRIKAVKTIGDYGDKSYGIVFENVVRYTITRYEVVGGGSPAKIDDVVVDAGSTYNVPGKIYRKGYDCDGWFTNTACTTPYTSRAINANLSIYAKYTKNATLGGIVHIDLRESSWSEAAANYAVAFIDDTTYTTAVVEWSSYVRGTAAGTLLVNASFSLDFYPLKMAVVRYNASETESQWESSNKWSDYVWNQTVDVSFGESVRIGTVLTEGKNQAYVGYPQVIGGTDPAWARMEWLNNVKANGSNHAEYYSTNVTLTAGQRFKIQVAPYADGDYYGTYTTHDSIKSNFSGGGSGNINVVTGGTYAFYFDSYAGSLYITKVEIAEADEWAQYFLANVGCDPNGVNLPSGWTACANSYASLSGAAKDIIYGATGKEDGTYVEKAVARYDVAVRNHPSLTKFIVNSSSAVRPSSAPANVSIINSNQNSNAFVIIIVISVASLTAVGGYFFLRRKKEN